MGYYYIAISAIILVPVMLLLFSGINLIFVREKNEHNTQEKWLLLLVVIMLIVGLFGSLFSINQQNGFVNIISISGYLLSISIVSNYSKMVLFKKLGKIFYYVGLVVMALSLPYLISVIIYPPLKEKMLFYNIEQLDATIFSFAIAAMLIAGEVFSKKESRNTDINNGDQQK